MLLAIGKWRHCNALQDENIIYALMALNQNWKWYLYSTAGFVSSEKYLYWVGYKGYFNSKNSIIAHKMRFLEHVRNTSNNDNCSCEKRHYWRCSFGRILIIETCQKKNLLEGSAISCLFVIIFFLFNCYFFLGFLHGKN